MDPGTLIGAKTHHGWDYSLYHPHHPPKWGWVHLRAAPLGPGSAMAVILAGAMGPQLEQGGQAKLLRWQGTGSLSDRREQAGQALEMSASESHSSI